MAAHVRDGIEQAINSCQMAADSHQKATQLKVLRELLIRKEPLLLDDYISNMCELETGAPTAFKKEIADFLKQAAEATRSPSVLLHCMTCLTTLSTDDTASVVKSAIQCATAVARKGFEIVFSQGSFTIPTPNLPSLWSALSRFAQVVEAILTGKGRVASHSSDAVRLAAVKYAEQYALVISGDLVIQQLPSNKVIKAAELTQQLHALLHALASLLRMDTFSKLNSSLGIVAVKSSGCMAAARDKAQGLLLPPLLVLANSGKYTLKHPPVNPQSSPGASLADSVGNALKQSLLYVIRNGSSATKSWHKKLIAALEALGATDEAHSALRHAQRVEKRKLEGGSPADDSRKRARDSVERRTPPPPAQPSKPIKNESKPAGMPGAPAPTSVPPSITSWQQAQQLLEQLAHQQRTADIQAVIGRLQPAWLVEIVLANLQWLPSQQEFQAHMAAEAAPAPSSALAAPPPPPPLHRHPEQQHSAGMPAQQLLSVRVQQSAQPAAAPAIKQDAQLLAVKTKDPPRLAPIALDADEAAELHLDAVQRMLRCTVPQLQHLQHGLLVRLATMSPVGRGVDSCILDYVGQDLSSVSEMPSQQQPASLRLALDLLYAQWAVCSAASDDAARQQAQDRYQTLLMGMLQRLRDACQQSPHIARLLTYVSQLIHEAPYLPPSPVIEYLREQMQMGVDKNSEDVLKQTLILIRVLVSDHVDIRTQALDLLLQQATSPVDVVRELALKVVAARFYKDDHPEITPQIERFLLSKLNAAMSTSVKAEGQNGDGAPQQAEVSPAKQAAANLDLLCVLAVKPFGIDRVFHPLMAAYGAAPAHVQEAVDARAVAMARSLGFGNASQHVLADYITDPPHGAEKLLLKMMAALCDTLSSDGTYPIPSQLLLGSCKAAKTERNDVRFLGVGVCGLEVVEATALLPTLVQLEASEWEAVVERLLRPNMRHQGAGMFTPEDLLMQLLTMDHASSGTPVKSLMTAVSVCLDKHRAYFTNSTLSIVLQQCKQRQPLPILFMRLVILTYDRAPELQSFLLDDILRYLLNKQIWRDANQFKGFAVAIGKMRDSAYPLLLQLPTHALAEALKQPTVNRAKAKLAQMAAAMNLPQASRQLLMA